MNATDDELRNVRTYQAVTSWIAALGVCVVSGLVIVISATGMGF